ncbi:MAG: autorepressor SdpR family transcription factor [Candidatus Merdivicinus sp.]|jgi:ArsR family transcriptional regulator
MGFGETFRALSDPMRREILVLLRKGKLSAGEIAGHFGQSPAAMSYHLNQLKKAELVTEFRQKNFIYYELNTSVLEEILLWIEQFSKTEGEDLQ